MTEDDPFGLQSRGDRTMVVSAAARGRGRRRADAPRHRHRLPRCPALPVFEISSSAQPQPAARRRRPDPVLGAAAAQPDAAGRPGCAALATRDRARPLSRVGRTRPAPTRGAEQAAWALAALLDDVVLNTPWGAASAGAGRGLVASRWIADRCRRVLLRGAAPACSASPAATATAGVLPSLPRHGFRGALPRQPRPQRRRRRRPQVRRPHPGRAGRPGRADACRPTGRASPSPPARPARSCHPG